MGFMDLGTCTDMLPTGSDCFTHQVHYFTHWFTERVALVYSTDKTVKPVGKTEKVNR